MAQSVQFHEAVAANNDFILPEMIPGTLVLLEVTGTFSATVTPAYVTRAGAVTPYLNASGASVAFASKQFTYEMRVPSSGKIAFSVSSYVSGSVAATATKCHF